MRKVGLGAHCLRRFEGNAPKLFVVDFQCIPGLDDLPVRHAGFSGQSLNKCLDFPSAQVSPPFPVLLTVENWRTQCA